MALVKYNNNSISAVTAAASIPSGALVLLNTNTITSGVSSSSFTSNINSTYKTYMFKFINIHPATDNVKWTFQSDVGTGTTYGQTITSTDFIAQHSEADAVELGYATANDQGQGTAFQPIGQLVGNGGDECVSGTLHIFNPSNTTFVKHFIGNTNVYRFDNFTREHFTAGYFNTTTALTRFNFKFSSGNIDSGVIKMYGIKDS
tara:strand:- start:192 stop:800 length:609 start_codon:yes stop_codon:yes gene_type:complete